MTVLAPPRHPLVDHALVTARQWCAGHVIDDRPALAHAARVAVTIGVHHPQACTEVIAAALLHDGPEFAPTDLDLDYFLTVRFGGEVRRLVRGMQAEHDALDREQPVMPDIADTSLILLSTADKLVALTSLIRRATLSGNITAFFARRRALLNLLDHLRGCQQAAAGAVPEGLRIALGDALDRLDIATNGLSARLPETS